MRADGKAVADTGAWPAAADPAETNPRARNSFRANPAESRKTSVRAVIAASLFLILLASALLFGGHAAIDPLLQSAIAAQESHGRGDIVVTMPDGVYCRHMSFDNTTGEIGGAAIEPCPDGASWERPRVAHGFTWASH